MPKLTMLLLLAWFICQVIVPGLAKPVTVDCAFGGMWYAIVDADSLGLDIKASQGRAISKLGEEIKASLA